MGAALDPLIEEIFGDARRLGNRSEREAYAFDALVEMARRARGFDDEGHGGGSEDSDAEWGRSNGGDDCEAQPDASGGGNDGPSGNEFDGDGYGGSDGDGGGAGSVGTDRRGDHPGTSNGAVERHAGDGTAPQAVIQPKHRVNPTHLALLRLDLEALVRGSVQGEERCEITGLGPVPVSVARRMLGDSVLKLVLTNGNQVANVTHLGRGPNAAQRIALLWSQPTCSAQGCGATRTEADHRIPYAETRHTRLEEMDPLCRRHHDLKTYKGWALVEGSGDRPMVPPHDPRHPANRAPPATAPAVRAAEDHGADASWLLDSA